MDSTKLLTSGVIIGAGCMIAGAILGVTVGTMIGASFGVLTERYFSAGACGASLRS